MIIKTQIANHNTKIDTDCKKLISALESFNYEFRCEPDIFVKVTDMEVKAFCDRYKGFSREAAENRLVCELFAGKLTELGGFCLSCSLVEDNGRAVIVGGRPEFTRKFAEDYREVHGRKYLGEQVVAVCRGKQGLEIYTTPWGGSETKSRMLPFGSIIICENEEIYKAGAEISRHLLISELLPMVPLPKKAELLPVITAIMEKMIEV